MVSGCVRLRVLLEACIFLLSLPLLSAQTTNPSNGSPPVDPNNSQLLMNSRYDVDPLTDQAGLSASPQSLQVRSPSVEVRLDPDLRLTLRTANQDCRQSHRNNSSHCREPSSGATCLHQLRPGGLPGFQICADHNFRRHTENTGTK